MEILNSGLYIEDDRLYDYAASCAKLLYPEGECAGRKSALQLRRAMEDIRYTHAAISRRYGDAATIPAACEWLLDNWYMVQREYVGAHEALQAEKHLRECADGLMIFELCRTLLISSHGAVSEERCKLFLDGFQSVTVLRRAELLLFAPALRAAAVTSIAEVCRGMQYAADTSAHAKALEALFTTLRLFSVLDTQRLINSADVTGAILAADPSGDYPHMDKGTKQDYLHRIEKLARAAGMEEHEYARELIKKAKASAEHVGVYLYNKERRDYSAAYIGAIMLGSLFVSFWLAYAFDNIAAALLLLLPVSELVKSLADYILIHSVPPTRLPRMDMERGVPPEGKTLCVISTLLTDADDARQMAAKLEELRHCCKSEGRNLAFGLLADLPSAAQETSEEDEVILRHAHTAVNELNRKYGGGFFLFSRPRHFDGESWTGFERKRGAITELAKLICDEESELYVTGEQDELTSFRYILTLDGDTRIYPGAAGELIGAMLHPLNKPVIDEKRHVVTAGHAIMHPRMDTELSSATATDFALIFAGPGGSDPYGGLCGELYMDAFDNGGFAGKGIIDARAFRACAVDRFPEGRVLSHDALEGACLRGGFMGDAEFSDGFPARPLSYYKRLHRWTRGDWQNLRWIFCRDFSAMDRWRLFDSLRRSLISPMTLAAIVAGFFLPGHGLAVAAWAALLALLSRLFISLAEGSMSRRERVRLRRYTRLLTGVGGAIVQTFIRLWLLPYEAWVCLGAICQALWRMLVSHKRLLQWQTAAQSEGGSRGLTAHIKAMWAPVLLAVALLIFSPVIIGKSAGLMWLLSPFALAALALPAHKESELLSADRDYIINAARLNFEYLTEFSSAEDNFLPPDNFQEQPPIGVAHRTSPTNIGLAMVAAVAAYDMGIAEWSVAAGYIRRIVSTLERMPRHMGHYFNWYDTRSLAPLKPAFISTVDSGNLYASLLSVLKAVEELEDEELAERLMAIMKPMDFGPLYDFERDLFYICYDSEKGKGAGGWYDLMASEAMLTSYLSIAKGDVPKRHWRRLSRAQLQKDGFRGLASWTGTMFEYLMPELFMPVYRGSLLYESGRFCVYAQKRRVFAGKPWGISESAFYSLDPALNYRYKANGCAALALKRGQDADMVVSPYSSFLALAIDPQGAVKNLRRLERFGAFGRFGFIEALDFTPARCRKDSGEKVQCYMAHHVGMSIIAAANACCRGSIQRRFMADSAMRSVNLMLQERLPTEGLVIRRDMAEVPEKPERSFSQRWQKLGGLEDDKLECSLMSNGAYNIISTNRGETAAAFGTLQVYGAAQMPMQAALRFSLMQSGGEKLIIPDEHLTQWVLGEDECSWSAQLGAVNARVSAAAAAGELGELRTVELRSATNRPVKLGMSFVPILAQYSDYINHPAFWKLGISAELGDNCLVLHRLRRGEHKEIWLCVACDVPATFSAGNDGGIWQSEPVVKLTADINLQAASTKQIRFSICLGRQRRDAVDGAKRILEGASRGNMVAAVATHLDMSASDTGAAMALLAPLLKKPEGAAPRRDLWQYGISGDLPIICCDGRAVEAVPLLRRFCLIKSCGIECDLVYLSDEQGEYHSPLLRRISEALSKVGLEALLGCRGGVHFVPMSAKDMLKSRASYLVGSPRNDKPALVMPVLSKPRGGRSMPKFAWNDWQFSFSVDSNLPPRIWQHMLTNGQFGAIVSDSGVGCMWQQNAREMRVNMPPEDIRATQGTEAIWLDIDGRQTSLFAANDKHKCTVSFSPGLAVWEKDTGARTITTTAFIPSGIDARVLIIKGAAGLRISWALEPVIGASDASAVQCSFDGGIFRAENPEAYLAGEGFLAGCSVFAKCRTDFSPPAMLMSLVAEDCTVLVCGSCTEEELRELCKQGSALAAKGALIKRWRTLLSKSSASTGAAALDNYIKGWAGYQSIACRLEGRSSLYQSGGAIGFRDQLQDAINIMLLTSGYAREQILDCCRHQYIEGDVMHWWHRHPDGDRGIRSRCSDDLLWLVWALCEYVEASGDTQICDVELPYISSSPLLDDERDRYETPELSDAVASVLFHARAALDCCIARGFGEHDLPLFGAGDWNDGLDAVDGESVWLGWFFSHCSGRFAQLLERLGKPNAQRYRDYAESVGRAADKAWNGNWYLRGYLADGSPLGGAQRIDSLPQSFAAMSDFATAEKAKRAVDMALDTLLDRHNKLVKLFSPPFSDSEPYPGYIVSYGEGFRENGGQYTHAAIWLAMACLRQKRADEAWDILSMLLPENHDPRRYEAEPFVLAADLYSAPGQEGKAGWTWYTGSAAWYFRVVYEQMLGLKLRGGALYVEPRLPGAIPSYKASWTDAQGKRHDIRVDSGKITVDGAEYSGGAIGFNK